MTRILENPRLQSRQASADVRHSSAGVTGSRSLSTAGAIVVLALCLGLVSTTALSQACVPTDVVSELFRYSQLAERPEAREAEEPCSTENTRYPQPFPVPAFDEDLRRQLQDAIGDRALVERPRDTENTNTLYVGCKNEILNFDVAVEMRFYRQEVGADVNQLDLVYRQGDGDNEWSPFIDPRSGDIIAFPGTDLSDLRQWLANSAGEHCPFPAARFAVYSMCMHANSREGSASASSLRMEDGMPIVVGHSLGGAAAQFIATSRPLQESNGWPTCPGINAYAFGSTGLTPSSLGTIHGTLKTYASDCDWLVSNINFPFADRVQTGHLFTLSSNSHLIDSIQDDLCSCLRDDAPRMFRVHDPSELPQTNWALCQFRN